MTFHLEVNTVGVVKHVGVQKVTLCPIPHYTLIITMYYSANMVGNGRQHPRGIYYFFCVQRWPEAEFYVVADAGHSHTDPGIQSKLIEAADKYKHL